MKLKGKYIFDIETDNLYDKVTKIHCIVLKNIDTNEISYYEAHNYKDGLDILENAELIAGHNIIKYDIPVLDKLFGFNPKGKVFDTIVATRLIYSDIKSRDFAKKDIPNKYIGSHSLAAWGFRLGNHKDVEFDAGDWSTYSKEMLDYCIQDVHANHTLYLKLLDQNYSQQALDLEHDVCFIIARQERHGFMFDIDKAQKLYSKLNARRAEIDDELQKIFPPYEVKTRFTPKANNSKLGYVKGVPTFKSKTIVFNAGSRDQIADRLIKVYGWKPNQFSNAGSPVVDDSILKKLPYPPSQLLAERFMLEKRIGQLAEGRQAWLKQEKDGRIYGSCNTNAAVTGRATHSNPNLAQIPAVGIPYGKESRELFRVPDGYKLVGIDMSGLEIRTLAHFVSKFDGGKYANIVLEGDIHTENMKAAGLESRSITKSFFYAWLYGAGIAKIAETIGKTTNEAAALKTRFLNKLPALAKLIQQVGGASARGYLFGLDRRKLQVRSAHSALNTLLQSAGALASKQWLVEFDTLIKHHKDLDYNTVHQVVWVHDEIQVECKAEDAELVGKLAVEAIRIAGDKFELRLPLDGEYKIGNNWSETH